MKDLTAQPSKVRTYAICCALIFLAFLLPGMLINISGWLIMLTVVGGLIGIVWLKKHPAYLVAGVRGASFRKALIAATAIIAFGGAVVGSTAAKEKALAEAKEIIAAKDTNPQVFQSRLSRAPENVLEELKLLSPEIYAAEAARRAASKAEQSKRLAKAEAEKNAPQIAKILKNIETLPSENIDGRLAAYRELTKLSPSNSEYSDRLKRLEDRKRIIAGYRDHPETALTVTDFNWSKGGFGNVLEISITIQNAASFAIKDPVVRCEHSGASGTVMDSNERRIFEVIPANGSKRIKNFNMGFINSQASRSYCEVKKADVA